MFKSPRKNGRNTRLKIRHVIQISILLGVSIWLLYQIHHSDDKKSSVNTKITHKLNNDGSKNIIKLGRKVLRPKLNKTKADDEQNNTNIGSEDIVEDHESEHTDGKEDDEEINEHENENENENDDKGPSEDDDDNKMVKNGEGESGEEDTSNSKQPSVIHNERNSKKQTEQEVTSAPNTHSYETNTANYMNSTGNDNNLHDKSESEHKDDVSLLEEEKDALTDLKTLPESGSGVSVTLENAAT